MTAYEEFMPTLLCSAPFCQNTIVKKSYVHCWVHRAEREKYNIKRMEFVMPLWAVWKCKMCGPLNSHQVTKISKWHPTHYCRKCRAEKRKYCPIKNKIDMQKNGDKRKSAKLQKTYKITLEDYNVMLIMQNNLCAICKTHEDYMDRKKGIKRSLAVDHDHITGKVRGLLCHKCNTAIGLFNDTLSTVESAINYLRHHKDDAI
jgi:hypothetical protein